jgi:hypothetical protein
VEGGVSWPWKRIVAGSVSQVQCEGFWRRGGSGWYKLSHFSLGRGAFVSLGFVIIAASVSCL